MQASRFTSVAILALLPLAFTGCAVSSRGEADRSLSKHAAPPVAQYEFHPRDTHELEKFAAEFPSTVGQWEPDGTVPLESMRPEFQEMVMRGRVTVEDSCAVGRGVVRTFAFTDPDELSRRRTAFFTRPDPAAPHRAMGELDLLVALESMMLETTAKSLRSMSDPPPIRPVDWHIRRSPYAGVEIIQPKVPVGTPYRGVILLLPPLAGAGYVKQGLLPLIDRGWAVLEVRVQGLVSVGNDIAVSTLGEAEAAGKTAAWLIDERLSEAAFAAEAGLTLTYEAQPELRERPLVIVGVSAGALMTPAVAAMLRQSDALPDPAAAVLIAGGANLLDAGQRSVLGVSVDICYTTGDERARAIADRTYLEASKLDPFRTAAALVDVPVLQIHGALDDIVPASCGQLLWNRLGRPDRWTFPVGHRVLFIVTRGRGEEIADWIEASVADFSARQAPHPGVR